MILKHDIWKDKEGLTALLFSGDLGEEGRATLDNDYEIVHSFYADSHFEAMTKYYQYMNWGAYETDFEVETASDDRNCALLLLRRHRDVSGDEK